MEIDDLQRMAATLVGTTEDIKWENHLCFCVAGKIYAVLGLDKHPLSVTFKVPPEEFEAMCAQEGFMPAPYMARHNWVMCCDASLVSSKKWAQYLSQSYRLIKARLPKKVQLELR